jgi:hypothetical protein
MMIVTLINTINDNLIQRMRSECVLTVACRKHSFSPQMWNFILWVYEYFVMGVRLLCPLLWSSVQSF